jgi:hypothetical protein
VIDTQAREFKQLSKHLQESANNDMQNQNPKEAEAPVLASKILAQPTARPTRKVRSKNRIVPKMIETFPFLITKETLSCTSTSGTTPIKKLNSA